MVKPSLLHLHSDLIAKKGTSVYVNVPGAMCISKLWSFPASYFNKAVLFFLDFDQLSSEYSERTIYVTQYTNETPPHQ